MHVYAEPVYTLRHRTNWNLISQKYTVRNLCFCISARRPGSSPFSLSHFSRGRIIFNRADKGQLTHRDFRSRGYLMLPLSINLTLSPQSQALDTGPTGPIWWIRGPNLSFWIYSPLTEVRLQNRRNYMVVITFFNTFEHVEWFQKKALLITWSFEVLV